MFSLDVKKLSFIIGKFTQLLEGEQAEKVLELIDVVSKWVSIVVV